MDEHTQAISFANNYFALVDGLASGLESHFSENVVLDWFGKTVRGRRNVSIFMETHKLNSRHIFFHIVPTAGITYRRKRLHRKRCRSCHYQGNDEEHQETSSNSENGNGNESSVDLSTRDVTVDINQNEVEVKGVNVMNDMCYVLNEGDLSNLFKFETSSTSVEEIEQNVNRMKLEEEMAPTIKAFKGERGEEDGPVAVEACTVKYVEADGEIEFSRKFRKRGTWNTYHLATANLHTWKRPCRLQVAYTTSTESPTVESSYENGNVAVQFGPPKVRLPSLDEINEITNRLVPNTNGFGGFLRDADFFKDRKNFLENLETKIRTKDSCTSLFMPQYTRDKLVFDKPSVHATDCNSKKKKSFVFNYQIQLIIYEDRNFLREFSKMKI